MVIFDHSHSKKDLVFFLSFLKWNFKYFSLCPFSLLLPVFKHIEIPSSIFFSRLIIPSSLGLSSYVRCFNHFSIFAAFCWTCSSVSLSLLYWRADKRVQHSRCVLAVLSQGEGSPPLTFWQYFSECSPGSHWVPYFSTSLTLEF